MAAVLDISTVSPQMNQEFSARMLNHKVVEDGKYAIYTVQITVDGVTWTVQRRYSEFDAFDQRRFIDRRKSFLPPKKIVGNMEPEFLEERSRELEKYVRAMLELELWHQKQKNVFSLPMMTAKFFDFHQYEIHSIVDDLSIRLGNVGDTWLTNSASAPKYFEFTPIEMHAVTKRLTMAEPTAPDASGSADIGNTVDFLHRVKALKIRGAKGYVGTSNIIWGTLDYGVGMCKNMKALWITDSDVRKCRGILGLRSVLCRIVVHYSMSHVKDLLIDDDDLPVAFEDVEPFEEMEDADFSFNELEEIDESVRLLGPVQKLNFSHNTIGDVGYAIQHLSHLTELDLSKNNISSVERWNEKLGNLKKLILAGNKIENIEGLAKIYSLEYLDVSANKIQGLDDVRPIGRLPCLEVLILRGNLVRQSLDYRSRVFEAFGERCKEVRLDSKKPDSREMDTIRVRLALKKAKEEKQEQDRRRQERIQERLRYISGGDEENGAENDQNL